MFNKSACHLSLSSIKNNPAINSPARKELVIFSFGETHGWTALHQAIAGRHPVLTRIPDKGEPWTEVPWRPGKDVPNWSTWLLAWRGSTSTEWQEHPSKGGPVEETQSECPVSGTTRKLVLQTCFRGNKKTSKHRFYTATSFVSLALSTSHCVAGWSLLNLLSLKHNTRLEPEQQV